MKPITCCHVRRKPYIYNNFEFKCINYFNFLLATPSAQFYLTSSKSVYDMKSLASSNGFVPNG